MSTTGGGEGEGRGGERGTRRASRAGGSCESERDGREAGTYISRVCPRPISGKSGDAPAPGALISPRLRSAFNPNCMRLSSRVHRPSTSVRVTGRDHALCLNSPVGSREGALLKRLSILRVCRSVSQVPCYPAFLGSFSYTAISDHFPSEKTPTEEGEADIHPCALHEVRTYPASSNQTV